MSTDHVVLDPPNKRILTQRLVLRPWTLPDAEPALAIYAAPDVTRWLSPAMTRVADTAMMRDLLAQWIADRDDRGLPLGRWAVEDAASGNVIGGVSLLPLPPGRHDLEIGWQLAPTAWGHGYGAEAGHAVAHQAFESGVSELFAVVRPGNQRGISTALRVGMEWVGETDKYYNLSLQIYRLTKADLDYPLPGRIKPPPPGAGPKP
jgi:RimJ/RimL family protein N-acetyltransferase